MKIVKKKINVGVGFVTGPKNFKDVVKTYIHNLYLRSILLVTIK
jgi:hypothetical protein